ncbi:hypothetical protein V2J09_001103 [Rumex salicifolius]
MANAILLSGCNRFTRYPLLQSPSLRNNIHSNNKDPYFRPPSISLRLNPLSTTKPIKFSPKCCLNPPPNPKLETRIQPSAIKIAGDAVFKAVEALKKPAIALVLIGFLLISDPIAAWAASGGRMGGRAFSSSSPSRSYSSGRASSAFDYTTPYYSPTPFGGGRGFYMGPAFGFGVGAGSSFLFVLAGFAAFLLLSGFLSDRSEGSVLNATEKTSILKLQVGLLGMARTLQRDLNRIAESADTSTSEGLSYVLTETSLALLRHPDFCISAYSSSDVKRSIEEGENRFNQLSIEERGKFDEETLVNVNNVMRQRTTKLSGSGFRNEYIVITILVAAEGVHKLPTINGSKDLKDALQKLGSIPSNRTMAVEVLWTPQDENDTLSERELLEDYSLLRPL